MTIVAAINWIFSGNLLMRQDEEKWKSKSRLRKKEGGNYPQHKTKMPLNKVEFAQWYCSYVPLSELASNREKFKSGHIKKNPVCF